MTTLGKSTVSSNTVSSDIVIWYPKGEESIPRLLALDATCYQIPWDERKLRRIGRRKNVICRVARRKDTEGPIMGSLFFRILRGRIEILRYTSEQGRESKVILASLMQDFLSKQSKRKPSFTFEMDGRKTEAPNLYEIWQSLKAKA